MDARAFFAPCAKGIEPLLADELRALGAGDVAPTVAGVAFSGPLELGYRACLWSRTASRILLPIAQFPAPDGDGLYAGARAVPWEDHLPLDGTLAVDFTSTRSALTHTTFGALRTKDAIVDRFRDRSGRRPSVDAAAPDVRVNVHVREDVATVSVDLSGDSLHRRGWRGSGGAAPLKESLAAAVVQMCGWGAVAAAGGAFVDPLCGSGTLLVEAAWLAADVAPGLARERWGFGRWLGHDAAVWQRLLAEARERDRRGRARLPRLVGYDNDAGAVRAALDNVERAGLHGLVHVERRDLTGAAPVGDAPGVLVTNPPYGERLGERRALEVLYRRLGDVAKQRFPGWTAWILTGNPELAKYIGLRIARRQVLYNGAIECRLLTVPLHAGALPAAGDAPALPAAESPPEEAAAAPGEAARERPAAPVAAFANRLRKNLARLEKWAKREGVTCYRVYDADLPEYALEVDRYEQRVHVQERERPKSVDPVRAVVRLNDALLALQDVLGVRPEDVFVKHRSRHKGGEQGGRSQYEKVAKTGDLVEVREGGHRFLVNLRDYFDTGLFLDHRPTRALLGTLAQGRDFLNLFAYTATATVYAAKGGATSTTSVDLSNTYLDWAARNLERNGLRAGDRHRLERADCLRWIEHDRRRYGLVFLDPPTWSTSKGMEETLDVQRDHVRLLAATARLLTDDGILIFSTNFRRFRLDAGALPELAIADITRRTIPPDFARDARVHHTFRITRRAGGAP